MSTFPSPLSVELELRVSDLGQTGHVSNVAYVRLLDEARYRLFGTAPPGSTRYTGGLLQVLPDEAVFLLGQHIIEFRRELWFRAQRLRVDLWIPRLGRSSMSIAATVTDAGDDEPAVVCESSAVFVDKSTSRPWIIDDAAREAFSRHGGERPQLRPRPS